MATVVTYCVACRKELVPNSEFDDTWYEDLSGQMMCPDDNGDWWAHVVSTIDHDLLYPHSQPGAAVQPVTHYR